MGAACSCGGVEATQPPPSASSVVAPQPTPATTTSPAESATTQSDDAAARPITVNITPASSIPPQTVQSSITTDTATIKEADNTATNSTPDVATSAGVAKIAVVYYSMYGHMRALAEAIVKGARSTGASVTLYQISETLPADVLERMYAPPKPTDIPFITVDLLPQYDGIIFGAPTRYGQVAAQYKALWDATGQLWASGALNGKLASFFFGTATMGGGQETTAWANMGHFVHHGMIFVPMGYGDPAKPLFNTEEVHGGSPWGSGSLSGADGSRPVSAMELGMGEYQGKRFATIANQMTRGKAM